MNYKISKDSKESAYIQLYKNLKKDIINGVYPYGYKLPSKRTVASESGISVITVQHAYNILCDEGYIQPKQRSGYFVIYKESDFIFSASQKELDIPPVHHITDFKSQFPFSVMAKTMRKVLADFGEEILIKSHNKGCIQLRNAISAYLLRSCGINASPEQIVIGAGAEYLYSLVAQLLGKDKIFALENPSYDKIKKVYSANGITCRMLSLDKDGINSKLLSQTDAKVLHVTPFNSFPSAVTAAVSKRQEYLRWAEERDGFIVEDNYDSELTVSMKNDDTIYSLSKIRPVIYINTFSRTISPSVRVGYMVLPECMIKEFEEKLGFYSCTVPVFDQLVLAQLISDGDFERHINRIRREKRKQKLF